EGERPRAPEPGGGPAPEVVADAKEVLPWPAHRLVVDALAGVVAAPGCHLAEGADREVDLVQAERRAVDEVGAVAVQAAFGGDLGNRLHARLRCGEGEVPQVHVGGYRLKLDGE